MAATTTQPEKRIKYDRITRDYAMIWRGSVIGYAPTYDEAQRRLDEHAYRVLNAARLTDFLVSAQQASEAA
jgi:hypothetical protein